MLRGGIPTRLEKHQQAIELADARGFQRGADLGGVMAVVVDRRDVVDGSLDVEAAADSRESAEAFTDEFRWNVQIERDGGSRGGIANVVDARGMEELEDSEVVAFVAQAKFAADAFDLYIANDPVGLARRAVGYDRAIHIGAD